MPFLPARYKRLFLSLTCAFAAATTHAAPITITGQIGDDEGVTASGYAAVITGMTYVSGGTGTAFGGSGIAFCDNAFLDFPTSNSTHTYDVAGLAGQMDHPGAAARAEDYINWVFDKYYARIFLTAGGDTRQEGYGFSSALWEITHDYDGTAASLSTTSGDITASQIPEYVSIVNALKSTNIAAGYRSASYTLTFLNDHDSNYQSMVLLLDTGAVPAHAVPEPSSLALSLLGGAVFWMRRKQAAKA